jgi:GT2 family glycosyltransferase
MNGRAILISNCSILGILVLYRRAPSESEAFNSLVDLWMADPELASSLPFIVYDNSPQPLKWEAPVEFPLTYKHDSSNGGLASAYNFALAEAERRGTEWLLLLDQDTVLTPEFFEELIACATSLQAQSDVGSIVPKLLANGKLASPAAHFLDQMRRQFKRSSHAVDRNATGVQRGRLSAYNSGTTFRVSALRAIGGFPQEFWLDYLDHAVFHLLHTKGYRMFVMRAVLHHDSSQENMNASPMWRQLNHLAAQMSFVHWAGTNFERLLYRCWLLRFSRRLRSLYSDRRLWRETAKQALLWRIDEARALNRPPALREPSLKGSRDSQSSK